MSSNIVPSPMPTHSCSGSVLAVGAADCIPACVFPGMALTVLAALRSVVRISSCLGVAAAAVSASAAKARVKVFLIVYFFES